MTMHLARQFLYFGLCVFPLSVAVADCPKLSKPAGKMVTEDGYKISYRLDPAYFHVGEPFDMAVIVCRPNAAPFSEILEIDALMPAHRHGMNYNPTVRKTAPGRFKAEGFMFHMRGDWQFRFEIVDNGQVRRASAVHRLK